jgi:hypothetical protein
VPCPSDSDLIDLFDTQRSGFVDLIKAPNNKEMLSSIGIVGVFQISKAPLEIRFPVWILDFPGPGGCAKGYAYREKPPPALVESIDKAVDPGSPEQQEVFRKLEGNWYLYYASAN